jgi:hypothetical protein
MMIKANTARLKCRECLGYRIGDASARVCHARMCYLSDLGPRISDLGSPGLGSPGLGSPWC